MKNPAADAIFAKVQPPKGYTVRRLAFQRWTAHAPDGTQLGGEYESPRYAANRCHRATAQNR